MTTALMSFPQSEQLDADSKRIFAACLIQKMLPNYLLFCEAFNAGDAKQASSIVDVVWEKLILPQSSINMASQLEKLESITPEVDDFDGFGVMPASDFCVALGELLENFDQFNDDMVLAVSHISSEGIIALLEFQEEDVDQLTMHPLWQEEAFFQREIYNRLYDLQLASADRKAQLKSLRQYSRNDGVSNLGISLD